MTDRTERIKLARALKALAHPSRLAAVEALAGEPLCVQELQEVMGSDLSTVSRHLKSMAEAGILDPERQGQRIVYRLKVGCLADFLGCISAVLAGRPDKVLMARLIKEISS